MLRTYSMFEGYVRMLAYSILAYVYPRAIWLLRGVYSDTTQLDVEFSTRSQREQLSPINERSDPVDSVCRSWRHKQKHDWVELSWVELCRYKHRLRHTGITGKLPSRIFDKALRLGSWVVKFHDHGIVQVVIVVTFAFLNYRPIGMTFLYTSQ